MTLGAAGKSQRCERVCKLKGKRRTEVRGEEGRWAHGDVEEFDRPASSHTIHYDMLTQVCGSPGVAAYTCLPTTTGVTVVWFLGSGGFVGAT